MSTSEIDARSETDDLSPSERAALELVVSEGELPQSNLWKSLDLSSRGGSRIAQSLAEKGLIERKKTTYEGRVTYQLTPTDDRTHAEASTTAETSSLSSSSSAARSEAARETAADTDTDIGDGNERHSPTAAETHQRRAADDGETPTTRETTTGDEQGLNAREQRALALIEREGILPQSELWKDLDVTSRTGSRVATTLEDHGLIEREQTVYEGQRTYLLSPRRDPADLDFSLLITGNSLSPLVGEDSLDPIESDAFTQWLLQLAANEAQEH